MKTLIILLGAGVLWGQAKPSTRSLNAINWMEFQELVPEKIDTVLIPTGTMEAHGVINNGADNTAPEAMVKDLAEGLNALYAPVLPYGMTGTLAPFAGSFSIKEKSYRLFLTDVVEGWAGQGFRNVIVINGHGGPQTAVLNDIAQDVGQRLRVRVMVVNWWSTCSEATLKVFGQDGGHAGWNETAYVQAVDGTLVHPERDDKDLATTRQGAATWFAYPFPSSVILYQKGQGYPQYDAGKAAQYRAAVNACVLDLVKDTIRKWDKAKIFR